MAPKPKPSSICPTCGGIVVDPNLMLGASLGLTPIPARIFAVMARYRELPVSRLIEKVYDCHDGGCTNAAMQCHISRINKIISKIGLRIKAIYGCTTYQLIELS